MGVVLSFIGAPGSGKGTQGARLEHAFGFVHIATGDLFREKMKEDNDVAEAIRTRYNKGIPQPDEVAAELVFSRLELCTEKPGVILDPFPLSQKQIDLLNTFLSDHPDSFSAPFLIDFVISEAESVKRLLKRKEVEGRTDDTEDIIRLRYREYAARMDAIIPYYKAQSRYIAIDGSPRIEAVYEALVEALRTHSLLP